MGVGAVGEVVVRIYVRTRVFKKPSYFDFDSSFHCITLRVSNLALPFDTPNYYFVLRLALSAPQTRSGHSEYCNAITHSLSLSLSLSLSASRITPPIVFFAKSFHVLPEFASLESCMSSRTVECRAVGTRQANTAHIRLI